MSFRNALTRDEFLRLTAKMGVMAGCAATGIFPAMGAEALLSRPIPKSKAGERLPVVGLGTSVTFNARGDAAAMTAKRDVLQGLIEGGGAVLDTATTYGQAESICGELMESLKLRDKAFVATKVRQVGRDNGIKSIEESFQHLRSKVIDLMFIHQMTDIPTQLPTLESYKAKGRFRYIGISETSQNQDELISWMETGRIDFVEFAYSADNRDAEKRLLPAASANGVAVFIALPFGRRRALNAVKGKEIPAWIKQELGCETFAQVLLKFIISHPAVTTAIPATSKRLHMAENLAAGRGPMPDAKQREQIAAIWENT
jgi:aryl-alcohol dehydrogenase-like predicted oxidoreductase